MLDQTTYIAAEPEEYIAREDSDDRVYRDQNGRFHNDRADAIEANFANDFSMACVEILEDSGAGGGPPSKYSAIPVLVISDFVREFIQKNPDMVRVVLGDREAT